MNNDTPAAYPSFFYTFTLLHGLLLPISDFPPPTSAALTLVQPLHFYPLSLSHQQHLSLGPLPGSIFVAQPVGTGGIAGQVHF